MKSEQPVQPVYKDADGTTRFKPNAIVQFLLDAGTFDMNQLALMPFSNEDREQFVQLIGYSLSGFGELSYASDETYDIASNMIQEDEEQETDVIYDVVVGDKLSELEDMVNRKLKNGWKLHGGISMFTHVEDGETTYYYQAMTRDRGGITK